MSCECQHIKYLVGITMGATREVTKTDAEPAETPTTRSSNNETADKESIDSGAQTPDNMSSNYCNSLKMSAPAALGPETPKIPVKEVPLLLDSHTVKRFSPLCKQTLAASAAILLTFASGVAAGYSAILLPQLKHRDSPIAGDDNTASWIASMAALPMALGCLISGWMMEKCGRKTSQILICAPLLLGWILIACANGITLMLLGRFLTGLCSGLLGPLGPVYIGEVTEPTYRGFFLAGVSLAIAAAIFVVQLIGTFLTWQWTATICTAFPIISVLVLTLVPESPTWLIAKGRTQEGVKAFGWLRGFSDEANAELKGIVDKQKAANLEPKMNFKEKLYLFKSPELIKPLMIMIMFFVTAQLSGINAVTFYSIEIVQKSVGKGMDHYVAMIVIDVIRLVMSLVACVVSKKYGRRPLCFVSGIWTALSMMGLSMFLYFTAGKSAEHLAWIPLCCLVSYICAITIGFVPLPWIMCGEVFPTKTRGVGSGISSAAAFTAFFVVVKTAPGMMSGLGEEVTFLIYGIIAGLGTVMMYFILPETKGKSLQEIEEKFRTGSVKNDQKV